MFVGYFYPPGSRSGYGSRDPIESGSDPDLDPQHWSWRYCCMYVYCIPPTVTSADPDPGRKGQYRPSKKKKSVIMIRRTGWFLRLCLPSCTVCLQSALGFKKFKLFELINLSSKKQVFCNGLANRTDQNRIQGGTYVSSACQDNT